MEETNALKVLKALMAANHGATMKPRAWYEIVWNDGKGNEYRDVVDYSIDEGETIESIRADLLKDFGTIPGELEGLLAQRKLNMDTIVNVTEAKIIGYELPKIG